MDEEDAKILENDEFDIGAIKAAVESFGASASSLKIFGDSWTTVDCGGNKKARILKDPHKAFELYGKEWSVKINAVVGALEQFKVGGGAEIERKIKSLFDNLNFVEASLREMYKNSYLTFAATPCKEESQKEKRRMDRIIGSATFLLVGFKMTVESNDTKNFDKIAERFFEITEKISQMILIEKE